MAEDAVFLGVAALFVFTKISSLKFILSFLPIFSLFLLTLLDCIALS
jgi:hypothetical protein